LPEYFTKEILLKMPLEKISEENQLNLSSVNAGNTGKNKTNANQTGFVDNTDEAANAKKLKEQLSAKGPQQTKQEMAERVQNGQSGLEPIAEETPLDLLGESMMEPGFIDALSSDQVMDILKNNFGSSWFHAKDVLLMDQWDNVNPGHANGMALMNKLILLRTETWKGFVDATLPQIVAAVNAQKEEPGFEAIENPAELEENLKLGIPAGSDALTADIDIPLKGKNTEVGLRMLNVAFFNTFGVESGTLFDINLYASDWMFGGNQVKGKKGVVTYTPKEEETLSPEGMVKKDDQNEIWSMVKIRRNMTDDAEWAEYKSTILSQITDDRERQETAKKCAVVEKEFAKFDASVKERIDLMYGATFDEMDHYSQDAAITTESNVIYEEQVMKVKEMRIEIKRLKALDAAPEVLEPMVLAMHDTVARGLTYANEVYATQGAVLHTVYGKQGAVKDTKALQTGKKEDGSEAKVDLGLAGVTNRDEITGVKFNLRKEMYLQSANENVGDTLHALKHYKENGPYGVYRAGKYLDRLVEATVFLLGEDVAEQLPNYRILAEIAKNAVKEKKGKDPKINAGNDPKQVTVSGSYFKGKTEKDLAKIKKWTLAFGSAMTVAHKNQKTETE
jgi:hypothetical protein